MQCNVNFAHYTLGLMYTWNVCNFVQLGIQTRSFMLINFHITSPPSSPVSILFPEGSITNKLFIVQWDMVDDFFSITYAYGDMD